MCTRPPDKIVSQRLKCVAPEFVGALFGQTVQELLNPVVVLRRSVLVLVCFCRAHERDQQTDTQTDHATPSVAIGRI